jgi:DNA-binding response OmpR family regulator
MVELGSQEDVMMACADPVRALLVEDNPADATLTQCLLAESLGPAIKTQCAERVSVALRCLEHERFDVVILDLLLPDSVGLGGLRRIVQSSPEVPVVILSGVEDEDVEAEAFCEGAQEFLLKGTRYEEFGRAVERAIGRKRAEAALLRSAERSKANVIVGDDDILSAARPAEILVIGSAIFDTVRHATEKYARCFEVYETDSLEAARKMLIERSYDAVVLNPDLPDAWAAHAYAVLSELTGAVPVLLLTDGRNGVFGIPAQLSRPFCEIGTGTDNTRQIRRLLISATLQKKALEVPSETARLGDAIAQSSSQWRH